MNSRERVVKTLRHEAADMLPIEYMFEDDKTKGIFADKFQMGLDEFMFDYLKSDIVYIPVADEIEMYVYNENMMKYALEHGFARPHDKIADSVYDRWGVGWHLLSDGQRPVSRIFDEPDDVKHFQCPNPIVRGQFHEVDDNIKRYNDKGLAVVITQYYGLLERGYLLRGYEDFMVDMYEEPDYIEMTLDKILEYKLKLTEEIVKYDIAFGHCGDDYGTQRGPLMSLDIWRKLFKPRLAQLYAKYKEHNLPMVHHSCGDCSMFLDDMVEIGLDAIHPVQYTAMDIEKLGKRYGNNLVFYGGIDCQDTLSKGTPDDVRKNVEEVVRKLAKHRNMILAPINIMPNVPIENFEALVESVNKFRK